MAPLTDVPVRPVQCPRCGAWCLLGTVDGFKTAVTATPLTLDGYRAALLAGLGVYTVYGFKTRTNGHRKLRMARVDDPAGTTRLLKHPCGSWTDTTLKAPQKAVQRVCQGRAGCTRTSQQFADGVRSCQECDPPPFDGDTAFARRLFKELLGATEVRET